LRQARLAGRRVTASIDCRNQYPNILTSFNAGKVITFVAAVAANSTAVTEGKAVFVSAAVAESFPAEIWEKEAAGLWKSKKIKHVIFTNSVGGTPNFSLHSPPLSETCLT